MKCISLKFSIFILISLHMINYFNSFRLKSRIRSKTHVISKDKNKFRERKEELKVKKFDLKDGPLSWEDLTEEAFQNLMKTQGQAIAEDNKPKEPRRNAIISNTNSQPPSENLRSKTFRTVSPNDDTTVNIEGQKYSKIFKIKNARDIKIGFMGKTRLTRL